MLRHLPLVLSVLALSPATAAEPVDPANRAAASLKMAQSELGRLETARRSQASRLSEVVVAAARLRELQGAAMKLAMAATGEAEGWQQSQAEWRKGAADKVLAELEGRIAHLPPGLDDPEMATSITTLLARLATARSARVAIDGLPATSRAAAPDHCGRLHEALAAAGSVADEMGGMLNARLRDMDMRLVLLRQQITTLTPPPLPARAVPKPQGAPR